MAWLYKFRISLITTLAIILIILAVAFSVLRAILPHATSYVKEVQQELRDQTGLFVSISKMDADMRWLTPRLKLIGVSVMDIDKNNELLYFDEAIFSLDIINSVLKARPVIGEVSLVGADILVERMASKQGQPDEWKIQGIKLSGEGSKGLSPELIDTLKTTDILLLDSDVRWVDYKSNQPALDFVGVNLVSKASLGKHSLGAEFLLPDTYGDLFRLVLEIGKLEDLNNLQESSFNIFIEGNTVDVKKWLDFFKLKDLPIITGIADGQFWLSYRNKHFSRIIGDVSINSLMFTDKKHRHSWKTDHLSARFSVQLEENNSRIDITDLVLLKDGQIWDQTSSVLIHGNNESGWNVSSTYFRLQDLAGLAPLFLDKKELALASKLQLDKQTGDIYNLNFTVSDQGENVTVSGIFKDLNIFIPDTDLVFKGVDGRFDYKGNQASLELQSRYVEMNFGDLFRQPVEVDTISGEIVATTNNNSDWELSSRNIYMVNEDISTNTRLNVAIRKNQPVSIDMQTNFSEVNVAELKKYYPVSIMTGSLVKWLDDAFIDGTVEKGRFILYGETSRFPFEDYSGVMQVELDAGEMTFHFLDGWPEIQNLSGKIGFYNSSFSLNNAKGETYSGIMRNGSAQIPDLKRPSLYLNTTIAAPAGELQKYVWNSGLDEIIGDALRQFSIKHDAELDLTLEIPLEGKSARVKTNGLLKLKDNELYFPLMDYTVKKINGDIKFSENGISGENITAFFGESHIDVGIIGNEDDPRNGSVFNIKGNLPIDGLFKKFDWLPVEWFGGSSDWEIALRLPAKNDQYSVHASLQSSLKGTTIEITDSLSKQADEELKTMVTVKPVNGIVQVSVDIEDDIKAFAKRDTDAWWKVFLESKLVKGRGQFIEDLDKEETVDMDLEYVDLLKLFKKEKTGSGNSLRPMILPSMKIKAAKLQWDNWQFDDVKLNTTWQPSGMLINSVSLKGPSLDIQGQGSWLNQNEKIHESNFKFFVNSSNLGHTLSTMDISHALNQCSQVAVVDWHWIGEPYSFSYDKVEGSANFVWKDGQVKNVQPGTGGRLLGLLNIFKLHERLLTGFGDVYKEGFAFDEIKGDLTFSKGNATTDNVSVTAKAADIGITGRIGLVNRDYDLVMYVSPHSTAATAVAGTLYGGPVIGAGLVLLKKLFGVDEMLHDQYTITGSWDNPEVKLVSTHDAKQ